MMSEFGNHTRDDERLAIALAKALAGKDPDSFFRLQPSEAADYERLASAAVSVLASLASSSRLRGAYEELNTLRTATLQLEAEEGEA